MSAGDLERQVVCSVLYFSIWEVGTRDSFSLFAATAVLSDRLKLDASILSTPMNSGGRPASQEVRTSTFACFFPFGGVSGYSGWNFSSGPPARYQMAVSGLHPASAATTRKPTSNRPLMRDAPSMSRPPTTK